MSQISGQPKVILERPNSSGLHFSKALSQPYLRTSAAPLDCPEFLGSTLKSRSNSQGSSFSKAFSEPIFETQTVKLKGRLKNLKPKQNNDFVRGSIIRWEDFSAAEGMFNLKKKRSSIRSVIERKQKQRQYLRSMQETKLRRFLETI